MTEKIVLMVCLFGGFLWLRRRTRGMDLGARKGRVILGIFILLPLMLVGEKQLFERLAFDPWINLAIKAAVLLANFPLIGWVFARPGETQAEGPGPGARDGA